MGERGREKLGVTAPGVQVPANSWTHPPVRRTRLGSAKEASLAGVSFSACGHCFVLRLPGSIFRQFWS
jgi:hypothetical protein